MVWSSSPLAHTFVQSAGGAAVTTTGISTTGVDFIVLIGAFYNSPQITPNAPTDSQSNTYTQVYLSNTSGVFGGSGMWIKQAPSTASSGHTFTFGTGQTIYPALFVSTWSGSQSSPLDQSTSATSATGVMSLQTGSITPGVSNELLIAALTNASGETSGTGINSSFTITDSANFNLGTSMGGGMAYLVQTTAAAINPTWSWTGSLVDATSAGIASFKAAAAAAACPHSLTTLGVGCSIGTSLRLGAAFWAARKLQENPTLSRRGLILPQRRLLTK